jgi:menaquinone-specific isochorismate synthase
MAERVQLPKLAPDREALVGFLTDCRDRAVEDGHFKLVSITMAVRRLDPLAVLESIYDPAEAHAYFESPNRERALAGADSVIYKTFQGKDRFHQAAQFSEDLWAHTLIVGDPALPFCGPQLFCAFAFESMTDAHNFAPATLFVPRWQIGVQSGQSSATANIRIDPNADVRVLAERVLTAYCHFSVFKYPEETLVEPLQSLVSQMPCGLDADGYCKAVESSLAEIRAGLYEKIVIARGLALEGREPWHPCGILNRLRNGFPSCCSFSFSDHGESSFIGATPEQLLEVSDNELRTDALAASVSRGNSASLDARFAEELWSEPKNQHEHQVVIDSIVRRLMEAGVTEITKEPPRVLRLKNIQHLHTPIRARMSKDGHMFKIAHFLHPTPAVGGSPREATLSRIREKEGVERGLYAGIVGWCDVNGNGALMVGIRSGQIEGKWLRLFAGAGIVEGSVPSSELTETDLKLSAMLNALELNTEG